MEKPLFKVLIILKNIPNLIESTFMLYSAYAIYIIFYFKGVYKFYPTFEYSSVVLKVKTAQ